MCQTPNYQFKARANLSTHRSRTCRLAKDGRLPMKNFVLAAFAALSLGAAVAPMAHAAVSGSSGTTYHSGPYDNTGNSLGGRNAGTYGGN
jgi:hypothetical protein